MDPTREAFGDKLLALAPIIRSICARRLGRSELDDCVQDVFLRAYRSRHRLLDPEQFDAYVSRITHNLCTDRIRRRMRSRHHEASSLDDIGEIADTHPVEVDAFCTRAVLHNAMTRLPPRQREVVVKFHLHGMSYAEAADEMGVTIPAVNQLLSRARNHLRSQLATRFRDELEDRHWQHRAHGAERIRA